MSDFKTELEGLINRYSMENGSDTPDFMLAHYLQGCLDLFDETVASREQWYGREKEGKFIVSDDSNIAPEQPSEEC